MMMTFRSLQMYQARTLPAMVGPYLPLKLLHAGHFHLIRYRAETRSQFEHLSMVGRYDANAVIH